MERTDYYFKRLEAGLFDDLRYISRSAFGFDPGKEYYEQKNKCAAFGEAFLGYIAYSASGEPAAFYGVYAHPVDWNGKIISAAQSGDTMTHLKHTGKGLFTDLARMTYDLAREKGIQFVFGFPNKNSYPGFVRKLNWVCPDTMKEYRIKVLTLPLAKLAKKFPFLRQLYRLYTSFIYSFYRNPARTFRNSVLEAGVTGIARTEDFIKYKSFSGCKMLNILGNSVWLKTDGVLQLGDMDRQLAKDFKKFIAKIRTLAFLLGADTILFQTSPGTFWDRQFADSIPSFESLAYGYVELNPGFPLETLQFVSADLDTF